MDAPSATPPAAATTTTTTTTSSRLAKAAGIFQVGLSHLDSIGEALANAAEMAVPMAGAPQADPAAAASTPGGARLTLKSSAQLTSWSHSDLLELIDKLTRQLRNSEATRQFIEDREAVRTEVLRRCLVGTAGLVGFGEDVLELINELAKTESPDVDGDSARFKELIVRTNAVSSKAETEWLDRVALLEKQAREARCAAEDAEARAQVAAARLATLEDAWAIERTSANLERGKEQVLKRETAERHAQELDAVRVRTAAECEAAHAEQERAAQTQRAHLENELLAVKSDLSTAQLKIDALTRHHALERDAEIDALQARIRDLELFTKSDRELVDLARQQASRETIVTALEKHAQELKGKLDRTEDELMATRREVVEAELNSHEEVRPVQDSTRSDYLRKVALTLLTDPSPSVRAALIPVLVTLMGFTDEERAKCEAHALANDSSIIGQSGLGTSIQHHLGAGGAAKGGLGSAANNNNGVGLVDTLWWMTGLAGPAAAPASPSTTSATAM